MRRSAYLRALSKLNASNAYLTDSVRTYLANKAKVDAKTHVWHESDVWQVPKAQRPTCGAQTRAGVPCKRQVIAGKPRCPNHGGMSTGPKTPEGRAAIGESNKRRRKHPLPEAPSVPQEPASAVVPTNTLAAPDPPVPMLTEAQQRAAIHLAIDALNDAEIARQCGVSRRTLARWKGLPDFHALYADVYEKVCEIRGALWGQAEREEVIEMLEAIFFSEAYGLVRQGA